MLSLLSLPTCMIVYNWREVNDCYLSSLNPFLSPLHFLASSNFIAPLSSLLKPMITIHVTNYFRREFQSCGTFIVCGYGRKMKMMLRFEMYHHTFLLHRLNPLMPNIPLPPLLLCSLPHWSLHNSPCSLPSNSTHAPELWLEARIMRDSWER